MRGGQPEWHILLVDDDADCRFICRTFLVYSGLRVTECADGESALRLARTARPDLILLDLSLPVLDGWAAARILKRGEDTAAIPIIALTAHAFPEQRDHAARAGFDGYLTKPVAPRAILDEVRTRLGLEPARAPEPGSAHAAR